MWRNCPISRRRKRCRILSRLWLSCFFRSRFSANCNPAFSGPNRAMPLRYATRFESHTPKSLVMRTSFFFILVAISKPLSLFCNLRKLPQELLQKSCDAGLQCKISARISISHFCGVCGLKCKNSVFLCVKVRLLKQHLLHQLTLNDAIWR